LKEAPPPLQPPHESKLTDGDRVRADWDLFDDGDYERCGTLGCILANKHAVRVVSTRLLPPLPPRTSHV
jgi:hypothetical protein